LAEKTRGQSGSRWSSGAAILPWVVAGVAIGVAFGVLVSQPAPVPVPPESRWTSYAEVYTRVAPVVVNVTLGSPEPRVGSGFAISGDHVVTARHIVVGADGPVTVRTVDGTALRAWVVGTDAKTDLALLEAEGPGFKPATMGRSSDLAVGDTVLAIGNPYGLGHSLAVGVLGSRDRRLEVEAGEGPRVDFLQLTIPLNPGNSGGPIFDEQGRVVGMLAGTHAQGQAIAFAVPVEALREVLPALMEGARMSTAFLGVRTEAAEGGVRVVSVVPSGPAGRAGIRAGDLIQYVGGTRVNTQAELRLAIDALPVTSYVFLKLARGGRTVAVDVGLEDRAERPLVVAGMTLRPEPGSGGRVMALRPRSRAERAGVLEGDLIRTVRGVPVLAPADVQDLLSGGEGARLDLLRHGIVVTVQLEP